jgi:hypothetical protein
VGVSGDALRPTEIRAFFMLTAALRLAPLHSAATDRRVLSLRDGVIGHGVSLLFGQPLFPATDDLSGAPQCEGNRVSKDFSLRHSRVLAPFAGGLNRPTQHFILNGKDGVYGDE